MEIDPIHNVNNLSNASEYVTPSDLNLTLKLYNWVSAKDKNEKPFAMAFVKLLNKNGTTLKDEGHDLLVYKVCIRQG